MYELRRHKPCTHGGGHGDGCYRHRQIITATTRWLLQTVTWSLLTQSGCWRQWGYRCYCYGVIYGSSTSITAMYITIAVLVVEISWLILTSRGDEFFLPRFSIVHFPYLPIILGGSHALITFMCRCQISWSKIIYLSVNIVTIHSVFKLSRRYERNKSSHILWKLNNISLLFLLFLLII